MTKNEVISIMDRAGVAVNTGHPIPLTGIRVLTFNKYERKVPYISDLRAIIDTDDELITIIHCSEMKEKPGKDMVEFEDYDTYAGVNYKYLKTGVDYYGFDAITHIGLEWRL